MSHPFFSRLQAALLLPCLVLLQMVAVPTLPANAQFSKLKDKFTETAVCGVGGYSGFKLGQKFGAAQAQALHLPPAQAQAMQRQYEIGMAMALCKGGSAVAGTIFAKLDEKAKKQREDEINSALADAQPSTKTYPVADQPGMTETITTQPIVADNHGGDCRVVEDDLAGGGDSGKALVKFCHQPPDGPWKPSTSLT
jgi:hypothetical protein